MCPAGVPTHPTGASFLSGRPLMATPAWQLLLRTSNDLTLTVGRFMLALVFLGHGTQKMFGWFGGPGFSRTLEVFDATMGIPPALTMMAMTAEVLGGLGLLA